jgi:predicted metalloprotease with PDZ domain
MGRVPRVEIGGYQLDDVLAAFVPLEQSGFPDTDVFLGMGIFSQFNLVFDYPGRRMFVTPNRRFGIRAEYDMSGLTLRRSGDDGLRVTRVLPDTPAAEAGLQAGDLIHHIDGRPAAEIEFPELQSMLRQRGMTLHLEYLREGKREEVSITLRPLI